MFDRIRRVVRRETEPFPNLQDVTLTPIGYVRNKTKEPMPDGWADIESTIIIRVEYAPMLLNLVDYSHIIVVFWPHLVPDDVRGSKLQLHPRDDPKYPLMGVLATRSQIRPNPVLTTPVLLLEVRDATLRVRGLDAINNTPVLDLKPYLPHYDAILDARVPKWVGDAQAWRDR